MTVEEAARAYVAARLRLAGADGSDLLVRAVECDMAWHDLHVACGEPFPDCCDDEVEEPTLTRHGTEATVHDRKGRL